MTCHRWGILVEAVEECWSSLHDKMGREQTD